MVRSVRDYLSGAVTSEVYVWLDIFGERVCDGGGGSMRGACRGEGGGAGLERQPAWPAVPTHLFMGDGGSTGSYRAVAHG